MKKISWCKKQKAGIKIQEPSQNSLKSNENIFHSQYAVSPCGVVLTMFFQKQLMIISAGNIMKMQKKA